MIGNKTERKAEATDTKEQREIRKYSWQLRAQDGREGREGWEVGVTLLYGFNGDVLPERLLFSG